jgi:hypothetical protein
VALAAEKSPQAKLEPNRGIIQHNPSEMDKCFFAHPFGMEVKNSKDIRRRMWHL